MGSRMTGPAGRPSGPTAFESRTSHCPYAVAAHAMLRKARVRDRERRQQLLGTGVRGSTISDRKGGWGATRGYPRLTPGTRANRLFEIALLDAIESLHSHSDLLRQME